MKTKSSLLLGCLFATAFLCVGNAQPAKETRYLAFQIFSYGPNPRIPISGEGLNPQPARFPEKAVLRDYIGDIKHRIGTAGIGTVGGRQTRLAIIFGPMSFDHGDAETTRFIALGFELAIEMDVAIGFHIDDSIFWASRKDLLSDPNNVEALDWDGTPNTGRSLFWQTGPGSKVDPAPPQMCFNSKAIQREVRLRSTLLGKAIQAGVNRLQSLQKPELFAGIIVGAETQIGQDFKTGKYLGYRALLNRGFSREHPPRDMDLEREDIVREFIENWTKGVADAGVSPQKIYSHVAPFPHRAFQLGGNNGVTYSQHNHFATTPVAFGKYHRPGFSTYPAPGRFEDLYEELAKHRQVEWASGEGTNLQLGSGAGQSGMTMETYLAKMFNHGCMLVNLFSWGIGGDANKNMSFRVATEGEEALQAYRKFLKGEALIEAATGTTTLLERLPPKIHRIQAELPGWLQKSGDPGKASEATALMQKLQEQLKSKAFEEAEKTADSILMLMGVSSGGVAPPNLHQISPGLSADDLQTRLTAKVELVQDGARKWAESGRDPSPIAQVMEEKVKPLLETGRLAEAEGEVDLVLDQLYPDGKSPELPVAPAGVAPAKPAPQRVPEEVRQKLRHNLDSSFVVYRDKVQEELKLTEGQKAKLEEVLTKIMQFFGSIEGLSPEEFGKAFRAHRTEAKEALAVVLTATLTEGQRTRLRQLEFQRDQLFNGDAWQELQVTDEQRKQFMTLIQQTQSKIDALLKEVPAGAKPEDIQPKVLQSRADLMDQLEALLTDAQKRQWKAMLGKPMPFFDLFDK